MSDKRDTRRGGFYWVNNKPYISVTNILKVLDKPALRYWFGREVYRAMVVNPELSEQEALAAPYKTSGEAKDRGSAVHSIVEAWKSIDEVVGLGGPYAGYARAFKEWLEDNKVSVRENEKTVVSKEHGYAGTLDLLVVLNGDRLPTLVDVKTGKDLYPEVHLQMSAYKQALEEGGTEVQGTAALLLQEDGTYKYELGKDKFKEFMAAKLIYESNNEEMLAKYNYGEPTLFDGLEEEQ